jgi:GT2 family glycosyltransferase
MQSPKGEFPKRLLVVMVNYKSSELLCSSLGSLLPQLDQKIDHVCVVDNYSNDHSIEKLSSFIKDKELEAFVELIASEKNGGFSYGNNLAIRPVLQHKAQTPEFILLLNPDTLVGKDAISELLDFMRKHPKAGISGSRLEESNGQPQCSSFRFHTIWSELDSSLRFAPVSKLLTRWKVAPKIENDASLTDWVAGASMMIRSEILEEVGLMDEDYFLYFEETDFCLQAKRKGWECWYVPSSRVVHFVGQSTGVISGDTKRARRPRYWFASRQRYFTKNHGILYTMLTDLVWTIGFSVWRFRRMIQNKPDTDPENMISDFIKNSIFFKMLEKIN